jgi:hypothetical protein
MKFLQKIQIFKNLRIFKEFNIYFNKIIERKKRLLTEKNEMCNILSVDDLQIIQQIRNEWGYKKIKFEVN